MRKVFFGTLIAHAQSELIPINSLLIRATNRFLTEESIDQAIQHLRRSQEHLQRAKESYSIHRHHQEVSSEDPHKEAHLS